MSPGVSSLDTEQTAVDGSTTQFQACSLSPSTLYRFAVSASTRAARFGPSVERSYWTEVSAPPVPPPASLTDVTGTTITLLLQPISSTPALPTSIITYFIVVDDSSDADAGRHKRQLGNGSRSSPRISRFSYGRSFSHFVLVFFVNFRSFYRGRRLC